MTLGNEGQSHEAPSHVGLPPMVVGVPGFALIEGDTKVTRVSIEVLQG